jgi:hypothetical protein
MWIRWITMGMSARWMLTTAVLLTLSTSVLLARWIQYSGPFPMWVVAMMVVASVSAAALYAAYHQRQMAPYAAIVAELDSRQRAQLAAVPTAQPLPSDPAVLVAALRLRRLGRTQGVSQWRFWVGNAVLVAYAVFATTIEGYRAVGVVLLVWAAINVTQLGWASARRRRLAPRWEAVAAAVDAEPAAHELLATATDAAVVRDWRQWVCLITAAAIFGGSFSAGLTGIRLAQLDECRSASAVVNYIYARRDLLGPERLAERPPAVLAYRQWSEQVAALAVHGQSSVFGFQLARISVITAQIADTVALSQEPKPAPLSPEQIAVVDRLVRELADIEQPLASTCR